MTPAERGRHCNSCNKTVVDFTSWRIEDIAAYLKKYRSRGVCGRFRNEQLGIEIPYDSEQWVHYLSHSRLSLLQRTMLIALLAFGILASGCSSDEGRNPKTQTAQSTLGLIALPQTTTDSNTADATIKGEVGIAESDTAAGQSERCKRTSGKSAKHRESKEATNTVVGDAVIETTMGVPAFAEPIPPAKTDSAGKH